MRVLLLADPNGSHTIKWARSLAHCGLEVGIFGLSTPDMSNYENYPNIQLFSFGFNRALISAEIGSLLKLRYLRSLPAVKETIRDFQPDIVHAHFATSYGLLGALSRFQPYVLSVWGTDVFDFPRKSWLHRMVLQYNLQQAKIVLSTSGAMAEEARAYARKEIEVIPFGVDLNVFKPERVSSLFGETDIMIGTIKALETRYGIEYLLRAFHILKEKHPNLPLRLLIVGGGSREEHLRRLAKELNVERDTVFTGRVSYDQVPRYHNMLSVFSSLSLSESFGVATLEASACEKPVVVSDVGGQPEVVEDGITGIVVPPRNPEKAAEAIERLVLNEDLRVTLGRAGRERVKRLYNWQDCVQQMIRVYGRVAA